MHNSESTEPPSQDDLKAEVSTDAPQQLAPIGWNSSRISEFAQYADRDLIPGRVARVDGKSVLLITATGTARAETSTELQSAAETAEGLPATGDWVGFSTRPTHGTDLIEVILPRRSVLTRTRQVLKSAVERQVVAVNLDVVFIVNAANNVNLRRLEREAAQVASSGAEVIILLNKSDLCEDMDQLLEDIYASVPHVTVHSVSGITGDGVEALVNYARPDRTVAFIGASGVGKSTLINRLLGREEMETGEVRADDQRGRHTTTARYLLPLDDGGVLIDTPGVRSLGLSDAAEGVDTVFDDITTLALNCRFSNCTHGDDPGCAVREAIRNGDLDKARLISFLKLEREAEFIASKADRQLQNNRRETWKARAKRTRQIAKEQKKLDPFE